jgi:tol-pal system protein YbgF
MQLILAVLLIATIVGPAYPEDKEMLRLQADVIQLAQQVKQIQSSLDQNNSVMKALVEKMADQVNTLAVGMQRMSQTIDGVKGQNDVGTKELRTILSGLSTNMTDLQEAMSSVRAQVNSLSQQVTSMKTTAEPLAKPDDLWRTAFGDYSAGNFDLAISDLQDFLSKYPADMRAADAHFMIGESLSAQKKYDQALNEYDIVLQKYPDSDKTKTALLKKGLALADTNQPQAVNVLTDVVKKFPNTSESNAAGAKLKELQQPPAARRAPAQVKGKGQ